MACSTASTDKTNTRMTALERKVNALSQQFKFFQEITGTCTPTGGQVTDIYTNVYDADTGIFTLTFASEEGQFFQVQQSTNLSVWTVAENNVQAADDPAISTEWESASFELDDLPVYFRVRRLPTVFTACPPPDAVGCQWVLDPTS